MKTIKTMFTIRRFLSNSLNGNGIKAINNFQWNNFHTSNCSQQNQEKSNQLPVIRNPFDSAKDRSKETYLDMLTIFENHDIRKRNHVEFIYAALKSMEEFKVERDIEVYKALIDIMPKGKFIPTNVFQAEFMHYPKQQQCIIDLLEQMEDYGVIPDYEMQAMLLNIFGRRGHPLRKYWRMMYWMPKFKNLSPWPLPNPVPDDILETAKLAVERMCSVDLLSKVTIYESKNLKDFIDDTWIVSGISPEQSNLLEQHKKNQAIFIEGPFLIWIRNKPINYFTLRADPNVDYLKKLQNHYLDTDDVSKIGIPIFGKLSNQKCIVKNSPSIHQQIDGTIFAICVTGTSSKDSLLSWIRFLELDNNPSLSEIPVLFRFTSRIDTDIVPVTADKTNVEINVENLIKK